jgi:hypothetical protein
MAHRELQPPVVFATATYEMSEFGVVGFTFGVEEEANDEATYCESSSEKRMRVLVLLYDIA